MHIAHTCSVQSGVRVPIWKLLVLNKVIYWHLWKNT